MGPVLLSGTINPDNYQEFVFVADSVVDVSLVHKILQDGQVTRFELDTYFDSVGNQDSKYTSDDLKIITKLKENGNGNFWYHIGRIDNALQGIYDYQEVK